MSLRRARLLLMSRTVAVVLGLTAAIPASAQYPGQIVKTGKETPELRSIAVLEWTGDLGKPKTSRLVPVAVLDGGELQDGGIYLARPEPLALAGEVEYELDQDGKPVGLYDIKNTGQEQGSWVGYGWWKPMPVERPRRPALDMAKFDDDARSDEPVLHRKHRAGDAPSGSGSSGSSGSGSAGSGSSGSGSSGPAADSDPDRPTLHRSPSSGSSDAGTAGTTPAGTTNTGSTSSSNEPTLHRKDSSDSTGTGSGSGSSASGSSSTTGADDPDRPVLKKNHKKPPEDVAHVDSVPNDADPDRPRLKRGRSNADNLKVTPSLMGLPPDMQQAVAVSDAKTHPVHPWDYQWANPDDETKMKSALEDIARNALGLNPPPAPPAPKKTAQKTATQKTTTRKTAKLVAPSAPAPLQDEKFRVFELSYGAGATLVLSAHTAGPLAQEKFVTLVAQPDLYGNVLVLLKNVTDGAHLDDTPRMRLVDAVDALADNRGELLFELRGATQRQFALYRVVRGQAAKLFASGGGEFGIESSE